MLRERGMVHQLRFFIQLVTCVLPMGKHEHPNYLFVCTLYVPLDHTVSMRPADHVCAAQHNLNAKRQPRNHVIWINRSD